MAAGRGVGVAVGVTGLADDDGAVEGAGGGAAAPSPTKVITDPAAQTATVPPREGIRSVAEAPVDALAAPCRHHTPTAIHSVIGQTRPTARPTSVASAAERRE
jgi:hypothetical protein